VSEPLRYTEDRNVRWRWTRVGAAAGLFAVLLFVLVAQAPGLVERVYARGLWPWLSRPLSRLAGAVPLAVAELLLAAYLLWLAALILLAVHAAVRRRRRWRNVLAHGGLRIVRHAGFAIFAFYLLWGFNYARPSFEQRAGWPEYRDASAAELIALAEAAVVAANRAYFALHDTTDGGEPTPLTDVRALESAIDTGWVRATRLLGLPPAAAATYGRAKWPLTSIIARLGMSGIYSPLTAEPNLPRGLPALSVPHTMAHEKAHQRGTTSEAEANFLGFVAASLAPDPLARYSAAVFASRQLLGLLVARSPDDARRIAARLVPGITRDRTAVARFFDQYSSFIWAVASNVNNRYLRANRVRHGTADYSRSAGLIVTFTRMLPGTLPGWNAR
jgi:hypothetical protein